MIYLRKKHITRTSYTSDNTYWLDRWGNTHKVSLMDKGHIQNCIIVMAEKQDKCDKLNLGAFEYNGLTADEWIQIFRAELGRR